MVTRKQEIRKRPQENAEGDGAPLLGFAEQYDPRLRAAAGCLCAALPLALTSQPRPGSHPLPWMHVPEHLS